MDLIVRLEIIVWIVLTALLLITPLVWLLNGYQQQIKQARQDMRQSIINFVRQAKAAADIDLISTQTQEDINTTADQEALSIDSAHTEQATTPVTLDNNPILLTSGKDDTIQIVEDNTLGEDTATPPKQPTEKDILKQQKKLETIKFAAIASRERGKSDQYEKKLIEGLALDPDNIEFLKLLSAHYFESLQDIKALTLLKKVVNIQPEDHKSIWHIGQIYKKQGQIDTAQLLIEKAISLKEDHPKYYITLVEIHYDNQDIQKAIQTMEKLLKLRPTNTDYLLTMATLYEEDNKPTLASKYFSKVLEIDPSNVHAKKGLKRVK